ncbi:Subtilisin DY [Micromonospora sp. MW-13]|uniref:S8 family peptidase n=1 Tax=Micromonospora sp. MW-13 TaxID=2094022 RepID=UPI000EDC0532|nr:S8 family serine peptidase [Micromonospora sp. MW-13]RGC65504.1 Subtilisin DY [Micromonospora sp. MW-13]
MHSVIRWRTWRGPAVSGLAVVAVAATTVGVTPLANAAPTAATTTTPSETATPTPGGPGGTSAVITLISGDKVRYTEGPDGRGTATVVGGSTGPNASRSFQAYSDPTGVYVIPQSAQGLVASGVLDRELFDVQYLARNGYGDDKATSTPVIVSYTAGAGTSARAAASPSPAALPGAVKRRDLPSVSGAGMAVDKAKAADFWSTLTGTATATAKTSAPSATAAGPKTLGAGVSKVWLDQRVQADLSESVPLIGAPEAWAAGFDGTGVKVAVLDTGFDATHPDLQGKVVGSKSFVPGASAVTDGHGHGTHVAATVAGTGAGSGGTRKGVAPGADLMIGKVLADDGFGDMSWIIDGMEWAATNGAKIVSLSLGGGRSDGTDPGSQAVNRLTAETGALFVIAAGNDGRASTIGSPGAADAALTVAATDNNDRLASFSSRGPRSGDRALKPDIAAPGVAIVAARAAGTTMGTPVDDLYTSANGTSMATPHVAGAAAVLAQRHPDWTASQLKPTLMSTSKDAGYTAYEQGAGRVDLARAIRQQVTTNTVNLDYGLVTPDAQPRVDKQLTFSNPTTAPVTLTLALKLRRANGDDASSGLTAPATVTVPAGGSAQATVTLDTSVVDDGSYTGSVVAVEESTGTRLTLPVSATRRGPSRQITVTITEGPQLRLGGQVICSFGKLNDEGGGGRESYTQVLFSSNGVATGTVDVPEGDYHFYCNAPGAFATGSLEAAVWIEEPQYTVAGDATIEYNLDTDVVPINKINTPQPSEVVHNLIASSYTTAAGLTYANYFVTTTGFGYGLRLFATPTKTTATIGKYRFWYEQVLAAPEAAMTVNGNGKAQVNPLYNNDSELVEPWNLTSPRLLKFETDQRLKLASYDDVLGGKDVRGKLILLETANATTADEYCAAQERSADAGAAGILNHNKDPLYSRMIGSWFTQYCGQRLPFLWLDGQQWKQVADVLAGASAPYVDIKAQIASPYEYKLRPFYTDKIPSTLVTKVRHKDLVRVNTEQHVQFPVEKNLPVMSEVNHTFGPDDTFSFNAGHVYQAPINRVDYYNVVGPDILWKRNFVLTNPATGITRTINARNNGFLKPETRVEKINQAPYVFGQPDFGYRPFEHQWAGFCTVCRQTDTLGIYQWAVSAADPGLATGDVPLRRMEVSLTRDAVPITPMPSSFPAYTQYALPAEAGTYQLKTVSYDDFSGQHLAERVTTDWTFRSQRAAVQTVKKPVYCSSAELGQATGPCEWQPLIQLSHDFDLALNDTTKANQLYRFDVTARHVMPNAPGITGLRSWVSYDDGKTWVAAQVKKNRDGSWQVQVKHPKLEKTTGAVSVRTEAWDSAGNRVVQTIDRAYGLTA